MCGEHYKKMKKAVDNNHALQALPGDFEEMTLVKLILALGSGDLSMVTVVLVVVEILATSNSDVRTF